jgi:hypothetical protein
MLHSVQLAFRQKWLPNARGLYPHDPTAYLAILHPGVDGVISVSDAVRQDVRNQVLKNHTQVVTIYRGHNPD